MLPLIATNHTAALLLDAAYVIWLLPELFYSFRHKVSADLKTNDRYSGGVLVVCIWIGIYAAHVLAWTEIQYFTFFHPVVIFAVGIVLMAVGVIFRWYAIRVLGKYFTLRILIQPGQAVVQNGPYRWIRHPSYTGTLLTMFGLGLACTNWLSLIGVLAAGLIGYSYRVKVEEAALLNALGEPYRNYMQHTKRFIPFLF